MLSFAVSLVRRLVFYLVLCSSSGACGLHCLPCRRLPFGVSAFSDTICLTYCCAGGVGWAATLPFCYLCFSCTGWLAGVRWVLHRVSGSFHRGCDSVVVLFGSTCLSAFVCCSVVSSCDSRLLWGLCSSLLAFPCLRVGALLACGAYGTISLRSLQSRLPFVVSSPFHVSVCPSPALAVVWFGHRSVAPSAAPVCWALVGSLLRRFVALAMVAPSPSVVSRLGFFLWRLFGLGLVGCGPAWVPAFFLGGGTLLTLSWLFSLGGSYSLVVQAP